MPELDFPYRCIRASEHVQSPDLVSRRQTLQQIDARDNLRHSVLRIKTYGMLKAWIGLDFVMTDNLYQQGWSRTVFSGGFS
jgi:hypothetical protein